jgi:photosystem II stability/assembly factor-like uncharacterized protein
MALCATLLGGAALADLRPPPSHATAAPPQLAVDFGFVDASTGWITSYALGDRAHGRLYLTGDGGRSWRPLGLQGAPIYVRFFDRERGVAVTMPGSGGRTSATLRATVDGGLHWSTAAMPAQPTASSPQALFPELSGGWEMRIGQRNEAVALYRTLDGGRDWSRIAFPTRPRPPLTARMAFADSRHGLVFVHPDNGPLRVDTTLDGGADWTESVPPDPPTGTATSSLPASAVLFGDGTALFQVRVASLGSIDPTDYVYQLTDGLRWARPLPLPRPAGAQSDATFVGYLDRQNWWVAAGDQLFKTSNGGQDWTGGEDVLGEGLFFAGLDVIDPQVAWAIATHAPPIGLASAHPAVLDEPPHLLRTVDGGATWFETRFPPPARAGGG